MISANRPRNCPNFVSDKPKHSYQLNKFGTDWKDFQHFLFSILSSTFIHSTSVILCSHNIKSVWFGSEFFDWSDAVGRLFWSEFWLHLIQRDTHFKMRIILGTIAICFLALSVRIPGCLRNGSGMKPGLRVHEKFL